MKIFLTCLLISITSYAKPQAKVAVIDTGLTLGVFYGLEDKICDKGHFDYEINQPKVGSDYDGHGTEVTNLINITARTKNLCFIIYKMHARSASEFDKELNDAFRRAVKNRVTAINLSMYQRGYSFATRSVINKAATKGIKVFLAAGNFGWNLNEKCAFFPPCYKIKNKNIFVVGSLDMSGGVASYSNYGSMVNIYENGIINRETGTSFASPRALGKYIRSLGLDKK